MAIYLSFITFNYLGLYPALGQVDYNVNSMSFVMVPSSNQSMLVAAITVGNPTGYSGLRFHSVDVRVSLTLSTDNTTTLFTGVNALEVSQPTNSALGPHSLVPMNLSIDLSSGQTSQFVSFENMHPGQLVAHVVLTVDVDTFLVSATGSVDYTKTQDVPLSLS